MMYKKHLAIEESKNCSFLNLDKKILPICDFSKAHVTH